MSSADYYKKYPEKRLAHQKKWANSKGKNYWKNYGRKRRAENPEWKAEECKLYRKRHPERNPKSCKKYYLKNRGKFITKARNRRDKLSLRNSPAIEKIYKRAKELQKRFNVVVDHIIPLSKGGKHLPSNLQIIYAHENKKKWNSLTYKPSVIFS